MTHPLSETETRAAIRSALYADEASTIARLLDDTGLSPDRRREIADRSAGLVQAVRDRGEVTMMEAFLGQYGLSTREGIALMCLAEALLRVPDAETTDDLIADKIAPGDWNRHLGHSSSTLVNASTWALLLTGRVVDESPEQGLSGVLHGLVRRLGEPVIRTAVSQAMRELGDQFVLGRDINEALRRAEKLEEKGYTYSYDMLGEAARTYEDAARYIEAYEKAIAAIAPRARGNDIRTNPGISVKLSALHPRYEMAQRDQVLSALVPVAAHLAMQAKEAGIGFNIDAEEADRLDLSLDIIEAMLADDRLAGWDGFGVVVQAYGQRAGLVIDHLHALAKRLDRKLMVRLVKGAYWDSEIKRAQTLGVSGFPVFTRKAHTDVSYTATARKLLACSERLYPQFATHNAHTVTAILAMAEDMAVRTDAFEFQRLHGMGEALHDIMVKETGTRCRIYAPVGAHRDLLAYLVRRLLENGANSSFVNQIVDQDVAPEEVARDPLATAEADGGTPNPAIAQPRALFGPDRKNAKGWDLTDPLTLADLGAAREAFAATTWTSSPTAQAPGASEPTLWNVINPARPDDTVGQVGSATPEDVAHAINRATDAFPAWSGRAVENRAALIERVADLYEHHAPELMVLATREAGKTWSDGVAEVREAVDFCRYYANEARRYSKAGRPSGRGPFACISPWNFPLAIFTGQIAAALAAGNTVLAKPAEQTCLIATRAVQLMHEAGIPDDCVQLLPGDGPRIGAPLVSDPRIAGVCFTGSTDTAQTIHRAMAEHLAPDVPLIAETGGLNAMIVDSTALPEQAVRDIVASAFQSAGQRCSALRILYVQEDVEARLIDMLMGAMDTLIVGDPADLSTDVGPVIDATAQTDISAYSDGLDAADRVLKRLNVPRDGRFVGPTLAKVSGISALEREVFGPVLHFATFEADRLNDVVDAINARGYGLTLGMHSRVDRRIADVIDRAAVGNVYINRNQIGAIVGSQPFGGEGLSGTGPKAGGPFYLSRFLAPETSDTSPTGTSQSSDKAPASREALDAVVDSAQRALMQRSADIRPRDQVNAFLARQSTEEQTRIKTTLGSWPSVSLEPQDLPGPTGESNRLTLHPRGVFLSLGDLGAHDPALQGLIQALRAALCGNAAVIACPDAGRYASDLRAAGLPVGCLDRPVAPEMLEIQIGFAGVLADGPDGLLRDLRKALAARSGPILPLVSEACGPELYLHERVVSIDTTASGGNASLLAAAG
ncbi:MAG: bifunctional proline dehydrogenase/L-glutamate gamma-semialdehyde dehydrogenase PutA [Pseudomonadota bacterium]